MKNKTLVIIVIILVVIIASAAAIYFKNQNKASVNPEEENKLVTDDFSLDLPAGWEKTANTIMGVTAMSTNPDEKIDDAAAQKINFKSYLAVTFDVRQGKVMSDYMQLVKSGLQTTISNVAFTDEKDMTINGRSAKAIEAEMNQQGVDFKVLIVAVEGEGDDVWVISYNTTKSSWDKYKEEFYNSVNSFILKK